jgi:hypothetical protein
VVVRACGERLAGGVYLVVPTGANGQSVDTFLIDPPRPLDVEALGIAAIGTAIVPRKLMVGREEVDTHYVIDVVGEEYYPNVADFVEEVRRYGVSRRISRNSDFEKLDRHSRLILVHRRAHIANAEEYQRARDAERFWCPRDIPAHVDPSYRGMCAALWWEDIEKGKATASVEDGADAILARGGSIKYDQPGVQMHLQRGGARAAIREMQTFRYRGLRRPDDATPRYQYAAFASFPIPKIEVVADKIGGSHAEAIEKARRAKGITVEEVAE